MKSKQNNSSSLDMMENIVDIYIRVSTLEQAQHGYSVGEQQVRLENYCKAMGWKIHKVHIDAGYSGSSLNRPAIQQIISDVQNKRVQKVLVWRLDRLSRSQKDTLIMLEDIFLDNGCDFVSMQESFDTSTAFGRAIVGILSAFAQLERENIKERTAMGKTARVSKGKFAGSRQPLGYDFATGGNDLIVNSYEAEIVRRIFSLFLSGKSIISIATEMSKLYGNNIRHWNNSTIRRILKNTTYIGKVRQVDKLFDGLHEAIIDESQFYMAAAILKHNKELDKRDYSFHNGTFLTDNLLTGLLFCEDCGARMYARKVSAKKRKYICHSVAKTSKAMIKSDNCTNRLHPFTVGQLDNLIIDEILKLTLDSDYLGSILKTDLPAKNTDEKELFQERLNEVIRQMDKLLNLYQIGAIEIADISERLTSLKDEKEKLQKHIEGCLHAPALSHEKVLSYSYSFKAALDNDNREVMHQIIHTLIDRVIVLNDAVNIHWSFC